MIPMDIRTDRYERRKSRAEEVVCEVAEAIIVRLREIVGMAASAKRLR